MIRLLVVAETRLYREGLAGILGAAYGLEVVATAAPSSWTAAPATEVDIALVDVTTPGATRVIGSLRATRPQAKIVALAISECDDEVLACAEAGIAAYVPHEGSVEDLVAVVHRAARNELVCSPGVTAALMGRVATLAAERRLRPAAASLTEREQEILGLIDGGYSNKQIAGALHIAPSTVKNHIHHIFEKLGVSGRVAAAAQARRI